MMIRSHRKLLFALFRKLENILAYAQGKGYGSGSIKQEINLVIQALAKSPKLG
jgi:hypothetical protein